MREIYVDLICLMAFHLRYQLNYHIEIFGNTYGGWWRN